VVVYKAFYSTSELEVTLRGRFMAVVVLSVAGVSLAQQSSALSETAPMHGKKVCVADVANSSMVPMPTDQLKARLVENLRKANVNAENSYAVTILANQLSLSAANRLVMHHSKCPYMALTEIVKVKSADTSGPDKPPVLAVDFGLFKKDGAAVVHGSEPVAPNDDAVQAVLSAVDKASSQVGAAVPKK
jgi:hypothetical protein